MTDWYRVYGGKGVLLGNRAHHTASKLGACPSKHEKDVLWALVEVILNVFYWRLSGAIG